MQVMTTAIGGPACHLAFKPAQMLEDNSTLAGNAGAMPAKYKLHAKAATSVFATAVCVEVCPGNQ